MFKKNIFVVALALISLNLHAETKEIENGKILTKTAKQFEADKEADVQFEELRVGYMSATAKEKKEVRELVKKTVKDSVTPMLPAKVSNGVSLTKFTVNKDTLNYVYNIEVNKKEFEKKIPLKDFIAQQKSEILSSICAGKNKIFLELDLNINYIYNDIQENNLGIVSFTKTDCK